MHFALDDPFAKQYVENVKIAELKSFSISEGKGRDGFIFLKEGLGPIEVKILLTEEFCYLYTPHSPQLLLGQYLLAKYKYQAKLITTSLLMLVRFLATVYGATMKETFMIADIADYFVVTEEFAY